MWRRGEAGKGDARQGEGSGYFIKCRIMNTLIWDGERRWTGTRAGTRAGAGTGTRTGTGILHKMLVLRFGEGGERKGGTEGERDRDRDR